MADQKHPDGPVADAILALATEIRFLGMGGAARSEHGIGALEGHTIRTADAQKEIAGAIHEVAEALHDVADAIRTLSPASK
jgi:hypothetical protein